MSLHRQTEILGFCAQISLFADFKDPNEAILRRDSLNRNLSHLYTTEYSVNSTPKPAKAVD